MVRKCTEVRYDSQKMELIIAANLALNFAAFLKIFLLHGEHNGIPYKCTLMEYKTMSCNEF